jgi:hypothetical protein
MMNTQLTLYRCYWPQAFNHLKTLKIGNFKTEAFGLLMTLDVSEGLARSITALLPFGAVVESINLDTYQELDNQGIDELLLYQPKQPVLETKKN